jgi:hypothetical protein
MDSNHKPHTHESSLPITASREEILAAAEEAAKEDPGWEIADPTEKNARFLTQVHKMDKKFNRIV